MKRTVIVLAGVAGLAALTWLGISRLAAQVPAQPTQAVPAARPLQTRIGLVNMVAVLKNYRKFLAVEDSLKRKQAELEKILEPYRTEMIRLRQLYGNPATPQVEKDKMEQRMRELQFNGDKAETDAKKELMKMNGDAAVMIYKEVEEAVNLYARANNLELVVFYNDAITAEDYYHPANLQRKLTQPAAVMPLYVTPGMDISKQIWESLNSRYSSTQQPTNAAPQSR